jgi:hypothetical protein
MRQSLVIDRLIGGRRLADTLQSRLAGLAGEDPPEALLRVHQALRDVLSAETSVRRRLKLLQLLTERAEPALVAVEYSLDNAVLPLSNQLQQSANSANHLLKVLGRGYADIATRITGKWAKLGFVAPLRSAVSRAMRAEARRVGLAYRVYSRGSSSAWVQMYRLYSMARVEGIDMAPSEPGQLAPHRIYVDALLLALAEPNALSPVERRLVRAQIKTYGVLAKIKPASAISGSRSARFLIRPGARTPAHPLRRLLPDMLKPYDFVLDCARLVPAIEGRMVEMQQEKLVVKPPQAQKQLAESEDVLTKLNVAWSAPRGRTNHRINMRPRVDVVVGFESIWGYLAGPAFRRRSEDEPDTSVPIDLGQSEWSVLNISPEGLSLRYISGDTARISVGELVGVRQRDRRALDICVARHVQTADSNDLLLGLEGLGPRALPVTLGRHVGNRQQRYKAIVLTRMPKLQDAAGLLAPPEAVVIGTDIRVREAARELHTRVERKIDRIVSCELFMLSPVAL